METFRQHPAEVAALLAPLLAPEVEAEVHSNGTILLTLDSYRDIDPGVVCCPPEAPSEALVCPRCNDTKIDPEHVGHDASSACTACCAPAVPSPAPEQRAETALRYAVAKALKLHWLTEIAPAAGVSPGDEAYLDLSKDPVWFGYADAALSALAFVQRTTPYGIYIASKTKHAERWRYLRDKVGEPIISTWIDEAGEGESTDLNDLWHRCIREASSAELLILYREKEDILKGGWIEMGAALAAGVPVFAIGIEEFTVAKHDGIRHFPDIEAALIASRQFRRDGAPEQQAESLLGETP